MPSPLATAWHPITSDLGASDMTTSRYQTEKPDASTRAAFVLRAAADAGIRVGTDGKELLICPPRGMPRASYWSFRHALVEHLAEIIALIEAEERVRQQGGKP
jgi:hypothetical protein